MQHPEKYFCVGQQSSDDVFDIGTVGCHICCVGDVLTPKTRSVDQFVADNEGKSEVSITRYASNHNMGDCSGE